MLVAAGALLLASASPLSAAFYQLTLRADPDRVPADGVSEVVISVEVVDALGLPAPDGTYVHFATTMSRIVTPVQTVGGLAQTVLAGSNAAGVAVVSAIAGGSRSTVEVEFMGGPGSAAPGSRLIELSAEDLQYSPEKRVFVAARNAELRYQRIHIRADGMQYDMGMNCVRAQGHVTLQSGERVLVADALVYQLFSARGRLLRVGEEVERLAVEGEQLATKADESEDPCLWNPVTFDGTRTWVKASRAIVDPGQKVVLDHATFYVEDTRVLGLRRHVLNPAAGEAVFGDVIGFTSLGGVSLDMPYYYQAGADRIGSLHVTRNRTLGSSGYEPGWALGVVEEYSLGKKVEGALTVGDVTDPGRSLQWDHRHKLSGEAALGLNASVAQFDNDVSPDLRMYGADYSRPLSRGRLSLGVSHSDFGDSEHDSSAISYRLRSFGIGSDVLATPTLGIRRSRSRGEYDEFLINPDTGEPLELTVQSVGTTTTPSVDLDFSLPGRAFGEETKLTAGLTAGQAWNLSGGSYGKLNGRLGLSHRFSSDSNATLAYTYSSSAGNDPHTLLRSARHLVSLTGKGRAKDCSLTVSASQDLSGERRFGNIGVKQPLNFGADAIGRPLWHIEARHFYSHLSSFRAAASQFSLVRTVGRYRAALCYSPQGVGETSNLPWVDSLGYGYTYSGNKHYWIEFSASTF